MKATCVTRQFDKKVTQNFARAIFDKNRYLRPLLTLFGNSNGAQMQSQNGKIH